MGAAFGTGFTNLADQLAIAGLGVATLGLVVLGLGLSFSVFNRGVMQHLKDVLLRIIGGSAIVQAAPVRPHRSPSQTSSSERLMRVLFGVSMSLEQFLILTLVLVLVRVWAIMLAAVRLRRWHS